MSQSLKRNCLLRLLFSMTSSSVMVISPIDPLDTPHQRKVLCKLAAQRTSAHQEHLEILQLPLHRPAKHPDLPVVPAPLQASSFWSRKMIDRDTSLSGDADCML